MKRGLATVLIMEVCSEPSLLWCSVVVVFVFFFFLCVCLFVCFCFVVCLFETLSCNMQKVKNSLILSAADQRGGRFGVTIAV